MLALGLLAGCAPKNGETGAVNPFTAYSCTYKLQFFRQHIQRHRPYAAFARGRAPTSTGMQGCGTTWGHPTQRAADKAAMSACRKGAKYPDRCFVSDRSILPSYAQ